MKSVTRFGIHLGAGLALALAVGCGGDDDDTTPPGDAGPDLAAQDTSGQDTSGTTFDFVARVEGFGTNGQNVPGVTVELYDNTAGTPTGTTAVSDSTGRVRFPGLTRGTLYGFRASLDNYRPTFVWNVIAGQYPEERLWIVPNTTYQMALGLSGLTAQPGKSVVAGAIYWINSGGEEEPVGCAKVQSTPPTPDVRYMGSGGLPTTLASQPCTLGPGTRGLGRFVAANLEPGRITLAAQDSAGGTIGSASLWSVADAIAVSNIYAASTVTANPTPATCSCTP